MPSIQATRGADKSAELEANDDETTRSTISETMPASSGPFKSGIKLSRKRWFVLSALAIFGLSMAIPAETSSIFNVLLDLLDLKVDQYIYISQVFHYLSLFLMGPTAIFVDKFGIRVATLTATCFFLLGGLFKTLLYFTRLPGWTANKMYYYLASSLFGTQTYLIFTLLPLKVSETWFPVNERSLAWTILTLQTDVASLFTSYLYPRVIKKADDFKILAYIYIVAVTTTMVSCVACVTRSEPDHPPSLRMAEASEDLKAPFIVSFKKMIKHKDILLHVVHGGIYGSLLHSVGTVLQDIMTSMGLIPIFVGNYMLINAVVAIIMLLTMSSFVHKVDNSLLACKLGSFAQSALFIAHLVTLQLSAPGWAIISVAVCLTICKSWTSPHFTNMTAHMACGTVSQATLIGFSVIIGTVLMSVIQTSFAYLIETKHNKSNYDKSLMLMCIICVVNEAMYQLFFRGRTASRLATISARASAENHAYEHDEEVR